MEEYFVIHMSTYTVQVYVLQGVTYDKIVQTSILTIGSSENKKCDP